MSGIVRKTEIKLMRKDSLGLEGTKRNIEHHAGIFKPYIEALEYRVLYLGFKTWIQGHNVHEFRTYDGRRFTLRPFSRDGKYAGIKLSIRISRGVEHTLLGIDSVTNCDILLLTMRYLALDLLHDSDLPDSSKLQ